MAGIQLNSDAIAAQLKDSMAEHNQRYTVKDYKQLSLNTNLHIQPIDQTTQIQPAPMSYLKWVEQLNNQPNQGVIQGYKAEQQIRIGLNLKYEAFAVWYQSYTLTMYKAYVEQLKGDVQQQYKGQHVQPCNERKEPSKILQYSGQFSSSGKSQKN